MTHDRPIVSRAGYRRRRANIVIWLACEVVSVAPIELCSMAHASVLLVDDDFELNQMLSEYLSAEAFHIVTAVDGSDALKCMANETFDLVILDVMLPSISGFDVLRDLRRTQSVPVIMLTA